MFITEKLLDFKKPSSLTGMTRSTITSHTLKIYKSNPKQKRLYKLFTFTSVYRIVLVVLTRYQIIQTCKSPTCPTQAVYGNLQYNWLPKKVTAKWAKSDSGMKKKQK